MTMTMKDRLASFRNFLRFYGDDNDDDNPILARFDELFPPDLTASPEQRPAADATPDCTCDDLHAGEYHHADCPERPASAPSYEETRIGHAIHTFVTPALDAPDLVWRRAQTIIDACWERWSLTVEVVPEVDSPSGYRYRLSRVDDPDALWQRGCLRDRDFEPDRRQFVPHVLEQLESWVRKRRSGAKDPIAEAYGSRTPDEPPFFGTTPEDALAYRQVHGRWPDPLYRSPQGSAVSEAQRKWPQGTFHNEPYTPVAGESFEAYRARTPFPERKAIYLLVTSSALDKTVGESVYLGLEVPAEIDVPVRRRIYLDTDAQVRWLAAWCCVYGWRRSSFDSTEAEAAAEAEDYTLEPEMMGLPSRGFIETFFRCGLPPTLASSPASRGGSVTRPRYMPTHGSVGTQAGRCASARWYARELSAANKPSCCCVREDYEHGTQVFDFFWADEPKGAHRVYPDAFNDKDQLSDETIAAILALRTDAKQAACPACGGGPTFYVAVLDGQTVPDSEDGKQLCRCEACKHTWRQLPVAQSFVFGTPGVAAPGQCDPVRAAAEDASKAWASEKMRIDSEQQAEDRYFERRFREALEHIRNALGLTGAYSLTTDVVVAFDKFVAQSRVDTRPQYDYDTRTFVTPVPMLDEVAYQSARADFDHALALLRQVAEASALDNVSLVWRAKVKAVLELLETPLVTDEPIVELEDVITACTAVWKLTENWETYQAQLNEELRAVDSDSDPDAGTKAYLARHVIPIGWRHGIVASVWSRIVDGWNRTFTTPPVGSTSIYDLCIRIYEDIESFEKVPFGCDTKAGRQKALGEASSALHRYLVAKYSRRRTPSSQRTQPKTPPVRPTEYGMIWEHVEKVVHQVEVAVPTNGYVQLDVDPDRLVHVLLVGKQPFMVTELSFPGALPSDTTVREIGPYEKPNMDAAACDPSVGAFYSGVALHYEDRATLQIVLATKVRTLSVKYVVKEAP